MSAKRGQRGVLVQGVFQDTFFDLLKKRKAKEVFVFEGRPSLEAAQKTCQGLIRHRITPTLITDNMAGFLFYKNLVKELWISYQDIDQKGALCDVGALILGVLGKKHKIPVHLFPAQRKTAKEGRTKDIMYFKANKTAPAGVKGFVPLVDYLPNKYITRIYP